MMKEGDSKNKPRKRALHEIFLPPFIFILSLVAFLLIPFSNGEYGVSNLKLIHDRSENYLSRFFIAIVLSAYISFFAAILFNQRERKNFIRVVKRFNKSLSFAISSMIGLETAYNRSSKIEIDAAKLDEILSNLKFSNRSQATVVSKEIEGGLLASVEAALTEGLDDKITQSIRLLVEEKAVAISKTQADEILKESMARLQKVSSTVTIRGFLNLSIGIGFAFTALYFLKEAIDVIKPSEFRALDVGQISYLVGIRLSLTIIITAISYFFLSLYRKSIDETKYYQNEITFIAGKISTLGIARSDIEKEITIKLIDCFSDIDRNRPNYSEKAVASTSVDYVEKLIDKLPALKIGG